MSRATDLVASSASTSGGAHAGAASGSSSPALRWSSSEMELSNRHRVMSAAFGAFLTSLVVTPFDVVKTRLQAQINSISAAAAAAAPTAQSPLAACKVPLRPTASQQLLHDCAHYRLHTGLMDSWCHNCFDPKTVSGSAMARAAAHAHDLRFHGALDAARKLIKHEGLSSLWRGLSPTILMSIPSTVVYFSMYDKVKIALAGVTPERIHRYAPGWDVYTSHIQTFSPLLAGVTARAITTTLVSPIELVRTKSQSLKTNTGMLSLLRAEWQHGGPRSLWRGVGPTLMRDVPFSAIYWSSYEYSKSYLLDRWGNALDEDDPPITVGSWHPHASRWVYASFLAGAGSGMLSAFMTHPFDLIKTRRQIELYRLEEALEHPTTASNHTLTAASLHARTSSAHGATSLPQTFPHTTWQVAKTIVAEEGYRGLLSGLSARITKIAPACAIMISTYEASKLVFGSQQQQQQQQSHRHQPA